MALEDTCSLLCVTTDEQRGSHVTADMGGGARRLQGATGRPGQLLRQCGDGPPVEILSAVSAPYCHFCDGGGGGGGGGGDDSYSVVMDHLWRYSLLLVLLTVTFVMVVVVVVVVVTTPTVWSRTTCGDTLCC